MSKELEVTFLGVNHDIIRSKIEALGGKCIQKKTLMKRIIFESPNNSEKSFFRIRDEGRKITCTYKYISDENSINRVTEYETEIKDFEQMRKILSLAGLKEKAYQESYRETWKMENNVECMLDEWPGIRPFIEIEGTSVKNIQELSGELGFDYSKGIFGAVDEIYKIELGIPHKIINSLSKITFDTPPQKEEN